jgi:uncharacterized protein YicC (UPF0701 family)
MKLSSKSQVVETIRKVFPLKALIEQTREQIQHVE